MPRKRKNHRQLRNVVRHLKHWLVPHKHNDHRPHLIRRHGLAVVAGLLVSVQLLANFAFGATTHVLGYASDITINDLLTMTNQERAAAGLPALTLDSRLNQSASLKAANMFSENYWAHVSPSGIQPWYWFQQAGYGYTYAGENLARDFDTSSGVMQGWMNSAGHRANILNANYKNVGFAVENGTLTGTQTTLVVAHYGALAAAPPTPVPTPAPATTRSAHAITPAAPTPAPTVAATPVPTPSPTATPSPAPVAAAATPSAAPTIQAEAGVAASAPVAKSYSLFAPLSLLKTLNWGTLATIGLLLVLFLVYLATHLVVWRKGLKRWQTNNYKATAVLQVGALALLIIVLAISGFGKVG